MNDWSITLAGVAITVLAVGVLVAVSWMLPKESGCHVPRRWTEVCAQHRSLFDCRVDGERLFCE